MERELKLVLDPADYLRLASSLPGYAGERWLANHYFDTSSRTLRRCGAMLRIRETAETRILGLKQGIEVRGGAFTAAEREEPLDEAAWRRVVRAGGDVAVLDHPIVRDGLALAGAAVVPYAGTLRVLRKLYRLAPDAALELDLALFEDGSQDCELEVETDRPESLRPFVEELLARKGVAWREQTRTKYERFLAHPTREALELCDSREGEVITVGDGVVVKRAPLRGSGVFATRRFAAGEPVLELKGARVTGELPREVGMRWVQVGPHTFLDPAGTIGRHLNHSCAPSAGVRGSRTLVALRPLEAGEEVVYDYAMTEWELEMVCCCGTPACRGLITGYRGLTEKLRRVYDPFVSDYLRELGAAAANAPSGEGAQARPERLDAASDAA
ncbi:MAG: CYTH domain-containing protein [Gemmatimonadota bacterium]